MNTKERAFNLIAKIQQHLEKQELSTEKVELATIYDDLSGSIKEANLGFIQATDLISKANRLVKKSISDNQMLLKELNKAESLIKQIGLDTELTKVQKAKSQVNENINALEKYYNNLLSL